MSQMRDAEQYTTLAKVSPKVENTTEGETDVSPITAEKLNDGDCLCPIEDKIKAATGGA